MSVPLSQRRDSRAEFVKRTYEVLLESMRILRKVPTGYRYLITNDMLRLVNEAYDEVREANRVYVSKNTYLLDFKFRRGKLLSAYAKLDALKGKVQILYDLVREGNSFFGNKSDCYTKFTAWVILIDSASKTVRGVMDSDADRWRRYHPVKIE